MFDIDGLTGIRFDVEGDELRKHCEARAKYHKSRKEFYEKQFKVFKKETEDLARMRDVQKYSNSVTASNKDVMEQSKNHHADKARFFEFAAAHLKEDFYKLKQGELQNFEMIPFGR